MVPWLADAWDACLHAVKRFTGRERGPRVCRPSFYLSLIAEQLRQLIAAIRRVSSVGEQLGSLS